jgi:hypothetical protein
MHKVGGLAEWEVRARLLAGQSDAEIAAQCNLPEETVNLYGQLFFDVRPHLHAWAWVSSQVFGQRLRHGFGDDEIGLIWQAIGYFGGTIILDAVIAATKACCLPGEFPTVSACLAEGSSMPLPMKALLASMVLPRSPELHPTLFAAQVRLMELPSIESADAADAAQDRIALDVIKAARAVLAGKPIPQPDKSQSAWHPAHHGADHERPDAQIGAGSHSIREPEHATAGR